MTKWTISVDAIGAFRSTVAPSLPARVGNFRINVGDALIISLPAGSCVNQIETRLIVEDGVGERQMLSGVTDVLGNQRFEWTATTTNAGPCSLFFEYKTYCTDERQTGVVNRVIVEPIIQINGKDTCVTSLCMQTVTSRCLGTIDTWVEKIKYSSGISKYNVIHFTPIQKTGESGSCYSLCDQLQISPDLLPSNMTSTQGFSLLKEVITDLEKEVNIISTSDVVLNHTATNSQWLPEHPECGYNERNCPYLTAAIELDTALQKFSLSVAEGRYAKEGLTPRIEDERALKTLRRLLQIHLLNKLRLNEWFKIDIEGVIADFQKFRDMNEATSIITSKARIGKTKGDLLVEECLLTVGVARNNGVRPRGSVTNGLFYDVAALREALKDAQTELFRRASELNEFILNAIEGYVKWERFQCRKGPIGKSHWEALVPRYFTPITTKTGDLLHLANNGWVMDWDAEKDFAAPGSLVYLSRSLIAWSDCIKLRYGEKVEDNPFLWSLMKEYCTQTASTFHGIRLDNCHSTPMSVAKYCLEESRKVNPKLWVYAELFTGNQDTDLKFERELGLNALIRESMQSNNARTLAYHLQYFGGKRIGTLDPTPALFRMANERMKPLYPTMSPSLFFDCTHDNETPRQRRTAIDALPNAAVVAASVCALGSCRGYDELVPRMLSVVSERRQYHTYCPYQSSTKSESESAPVPKPQFSTTLRNSSSRVAVRGAWDGWKCSVPLSRQNDAWVGFLSHVYQPQSCTDHIEYQFKFIAEGNDWFYDPAIQHVRDNHGNINNVLVLGEPPLNNVGHASMDARQWLPTKPLPGIMECRSILNSIHSSLGQDGFTEIDTDTIGDDVIVAIRHNPKSHQLCYFFMYTAFNSSVLSRGNVIAEREIKGKLKEVLLEARLHISENVPFVEEKTYINGMSSSLQISSNSKELRSTIGMFDLRYDERTDRSFLTLKKFGPGSVLIVMTAGYPNVQEVVANSIQDISGICQGAPYTNISRSDELQAFSYLLYSCAQEERDRSKGARDCYDLESIGALPYAGIAGVIPILDKIRHDEDIHHPLIRNITAGDWLFNYTADRLDRDRDDAFCGSGVLVVLRKVASWLREAFREPIRYLPRNLLGFYLDWVLSSLYSWVAKRLMNETPDFLRSCTDPLMIRLVLATLSVYSYVPSAPLIHGTRHASLSAGLPHFAVGYMRAWGRDTFIALKGCLLATRRFQEARDEILAFARVMRHGLIPNLLDSGNNPRYNARDATWFFLQSVQDYCNSAPEGTDFLKTPVNLKYKEVLVRGEVVETVADLMHYILSQHAKGIEFKEWNAGSKIDSCMKDEGFHICITFDKTTGMIFGGNRWNCGTWMDKMGSSVGAGNMGHPATPRDGAAVEIIGLLKSALRFVNSLPSNTFNFVVADPVTGLTYKEWEELIQNSFERIFFVKNKVTTKNLVGEVEINGHCVNKFPILRDSFRASEEWRDYQLRPNFAISLAVSPELIQPSSALSALHTASDLIPALSPDQMQKELNDLQMSVGCDAEKIKQHFKLEKSMGLHFTQQLGMKTLDPADLNYRPNYNNDDRSKDFSLANGFSYHNGPEWVWPLGYFLQALFDYERAAENQMSSNDDRCLRRAIFLAMRYLLVHRQYIATDPWLSLPELTNADGKTCAFSCYSQAWSIGTILAFLTHVAKIVSTAAPTSRTKCQETSSAA